MRRPIPVLILRMSSSASATRTASIAGESGYSHNGRGAGASATLAEPWAMSLGDMVLSAVRCTAARLPLGLSERGVGRCLKKELEIRGLVVEAEHPVVVSAR